MSVVFGVLCAVVGAIAIEHTRVEVGDGQLLPDATVVIGDDGRISAVGGAVDLPVGARLVDGRGKTLTPGLIETRSQLGLVEVVGEESSADHASGDDPVTPGFRAADGFQPLSPRIPIEREEGVTSVVSSPTTGLLAGTGVWIDLSGDLGAAPDPARPVAMFGSVAETAVQSLGRSRGTLWLRLREVFDDVRRYRAAGREYERNALRHLSLSRVHLEAMLPVVAGKLPLVLEAHRASDLLAALRFAESEGVRLVLAGGAEAHLVARELAAARVPVLLRPSTQEPWSFDALRVQDDTAAQLEAAGVHLVLTAGGGWEQSARRLRQEAGIAVARGLPREAALRAITSRAAEAFGKGREVGTISVGKRANLVLWSGDPLELSTVAERVFIDGRELPQQNRQLELARRYLQRTE